MQFRLGGDAGQGQGRRILGGEQTQDSRRVDARRLLCVLCACQKFSLRLHCTYTVSALHLPHDCNGANLVNEIFISSVKTRSQVPASIQRCCYSFASLISVIMCKMKSGSSIHLGYGYSEGLRRERGECLDAS